MSFTFVRPFVLSAVVIVSAAVIVHFLTPREDVEGYVAKIKEERMKKEKFLRNDPYSPLRDVSFDSLRYYPVDIKYRVTAKLHPIEKKQVHVLATSTGEEARYLDYAHAVFPVNGTPHRLLILEIMDSGPTRGKLFLAFSDETSARETYGGGRYLDLKKVPAATSIELDFNKAYNPYCAYNDSYSCPLPPRENLLSIPILAGEKTPQMAKNH